MVVGQPFDTVKARLQTDGLDGKKVYRGVYHCFSHIVENEGSRALFKGMAAPLLGMAVVNSIVFGVHGNLMKIFQRRAGADSLPKLRYSFFSGAVAGWAQVVVCSPSELIKLRMQFQKDKTSLIPHSLHHHSSEKRVYSSPWDAVKKIYKKDGLFRGIGKGYWITCTREIPAFAFYFGTYDYLCRSAMRRKGLSHVDQLSPVFICMAGGVGGIMAWVVSYPADVVKSRYQIDGMKTGVLRYKSSTDCFRQSSKEGWRVFLIGLTPTVVRAFPVNAVTFVIVALILRTWRRTNSDKP
jgi:solute carrier family 25 carnitine/acylcarnitine transporter 20/29